MLTKKWISVKQMNKVQIVNSLQCNKKYYINGTIYHWGLRLFKKITIKSRCPTKKYICNCSPIDGNVYKTYIFYLNYNAL